MYKSCADVTYTGEKHVLWIKAGEVIDHPDTHTTQECFEDTTVYLASQGLKFLVHGKCQEINNPDFTCSSYKMGKITTEEVVEKKSWSFWRWLSDLTKGCD